MIGTHSARMAAFGTASPAPQMPQAGRPLGTIPNPPATQPADSPDQLQRNIYQLPEKYRFPLLNLLDRLKGQTSRGLGEVCDLMNYAGRRLSRNLADQPLHYAQKRAVEILDELIRQAEQCEKQQQQACAAAAAAAGATGQSGRPVGGTPQSPALQSILPADQPDPGPLQPTPPARPGEAWGQMRPEERQRILQSLQQHFPTRYRQLGEPDYRQRAREP